LSEKRAVSVVQYLISQGIPATRLRSAGYGESQLLFKPERSEAHYQANRRTEFTVVGTTGEPLYDTRLTVTPSADMYGVQKIQDGYQPQTPPQQQTVTPPAGTGTTTNIQNMPFTIQVAAISKPVSASSSDFIKLKQLFNLDVYQVYTNGIYRYYAGGFNTMKEARAMCDKVNKALGKSEKDKFFAKEK
jgi:septal ring-binding cell division protein DamX